MLSEDRGTGPQDQQERPVSDEKDFNAKKFNDTLHDQIHRDIHSEMNERMDPDGKRRNPIVVGIHIGRRGSSGLFWGAFLVLGGVALLLDHMGYVSIDRLWRFWPLLLVCAGSPNLMRREHRLWGILLIAGGVLFQLNELGLAHFRWNDIWPILLIATGLMLMWGAIEARRRPSAPLPGDDPRTTLNEAAIFGGVERRVTSQDFQGGHISAVFGGVEIDMTDANMQADEATLEINAIFGGIEIRVPETWQVAFRGTPIFGGIADKTRVGRTTDLTDPRRKVLILTGAVIFGGVEIKN
jgi:predicted membrane protein